MWKWRDGFRKKLNSARFDELTDVQVWAWKEWLHGMANAVISIRTELARQKKDAETQACTAVKFLVQFPFSVTLKVVMYLLTMSFQIAHKFITPGEPPSIWSQAAKEACLAAFDDIALIQLESGQTQVSHLLSLSPLRGQLGMQHLRGTCPRSEGKDESLKNTDPPCLACPLTWYSYLAHIKSSMI